MTVELEYKGYEGIYEVPEAAIYLVASLTQTPLNVTSTKLIRWIRRGLTLHDLIEIPGRELLITFEDLVSMRVIAALRAAGVSFNKIYRAEKWLRRTTRHPRPFATELLWTEHSDVFAEFKRELVAASRSGQYAMDILREYLIPIHGLTFKTFNKKRVAASWEPYSGVLLQPLIQFGAPCIKGTRVPTRTIWGMIKAGDSIELVTRSYGLEEEEVRKAVKWEDSLAGSSATAILNG